MLTFLGKSMPHNLHFQTRNFQTQSHQWSPRPNGYPTTERLRLWGKAPHGLRPAVLSEKNATPQPNADGPSPCGYATSHLYFFTLYSGTAGSRMGTVWQ